MSIYVSVVIDCPRCRRPCTVCLGSGVNPDSNIAGPCRNCAGQRLIVQPDPACPQCSGAGKVTRRVRKNDARKMVR